MKRKNSKPAYPHPVFDALRSELIRRYSRRARSTAGHEAGHAVAVIFFNWKINLVTTVRDGEVPGRCSYFQPPKTANWDDLFKVMVINCAGNVGRTLTTAANVEDAEGGIGDYEENEEVVAELFGVPPTFARDWTNQNDPRGFAMRETEDQAEHMARDIILTPHGRIAVLLVARALLAKGSLTHDEVEVLALNGTESCIENGNI